MSMDYLQLNCIKNSQLFKNVGKEGIESVPPKFKKMKIKVKYEIEINDLDDLKNTLETLRFYMVDELPYEVFEFVHEHMNYEMSRTFDLDSYKDFYGDQLKLICEQGRETLMSVACSSGYYDLVRYLSSKGYCFYFENDIPLGNSNDFKGAACANNLDILKFIYKKTGMFDFSVCEQLVKNNNYEGVEYLINLQKINHQKDYRCIIAKKYTIWNTSWRLTNPSQVYSDFIKKQQEYCTKAAIKNNNKKMLDLLCKHNFQWSNDAIMNCVTSDNYDMLQYVVDKGCPIPTNDQIFLASASRSDVEIIKFLKEKQPEFYFTPDMFEEAIIHKRYDILEYIYKNHGHLHKDISRRYLNHVVREGDIKMFKFLIKELNFHYSRQTFQLILDYDRNEIYEFLLDNGYRPKKKKDIIDIIIARKLDILELLQTYNFNFTSKINAYLQISINTKQTEMTSFFQKIKEEDDSRTISDVNE